MFHYRYSCNFRPFVSYSSETDDDPGLRRLCDPELQFCTRNARDYAHGNVAVADDETERGMHPKVLGSGGFEFCTKIKQRKTCSKAMPTKTSGFQEQFYFTLPKSKEVAFFGFIFINEVYWFLIL